MASSSDTSATDRMPAPSTSRRPGVRTGDSFMPKIAPSSATTTSTSGQPEQPVPGQVLHDRAGGDDADAGADAEDRRQQADGDADLLAGQLVADDADRQRQDRPGRALERPRDDQHREVRGERGEQGAHGQGGQHADEHPALADHVAEAAQDRREHRGGQQVGGEDPAGVAGGGVRSRAMHGQGRRDQRLQHGEGQATQRQVEPAEIGVGVAAGAPGWCVDEAVELPGPRPRRWPATLPRPDAATRPGPVSSCSTPPASDSPGTDTGPPPCDTSPTTPASTSRSSAATSSPRKGCSPPA